MRVKLALLVAAGVLFCGRTASAHRIDEYLQATVLSLEASQVHASMRLIPGMLVAPAVIAAIDSNGDGILSPDEEKAYAQRVLSDLAVTIDGKSVQPKLVSWRFPEPEQMREGLGEIEIQYTADLPGGGPDRSLMLVNHHLNRSSVYLMNTEVPEDRALRITAQKRSAEQSMYELDYEQAQAREEGSRGPWDEWRVWLNATHFGTLFRLGMRHIAEGTDHLLFLLTLLLPAPLVIVASRWGPPARVRQSLLRILSIVTAFTLGHSMTLTFAAMGFVHVPGRPIEVLIAVSILVSALHALRPIVPGKEAYIAGFFGLIHGLAFAATLDRLGLGRWERMGGILAFNLGIEATQMLVVAAILPSLILLSRTRPYSMFRVAGAVFAAVASVGWAVERTFEVTMPVDSVVNAIAGHALLLAVALLVVSVACRLLLSVNADAPARTPVISSVPQGSGV